MGDRVQMPEWADPAALARLFQDDRPPISCWLVRDAVIACIVLQTEPAGARQSPLGEPLEVDAGGVRLRLDGEAGQQPPAGCRRMPCRQRSLD